MGGRVGRADGNGALALLRRFASRLPVYAFTNSNPTHRRVWAKDDTDALHAFRKVFVSCELGRRKPEAAAFAAIAVEIGVPLARILFFDDTLENVEGARTVGMPVVHVRSMADVDTAVAGFLR